MSDVHKNARTTPTLDANLPQTCPEVFVGTLGGGDDRRQSTPAQR
jgi:hypothetical protein